MTLLIVFLGSAMLISFLCSVLESVLMSTPLSYVTMREETDGESGGTRPSRAQRGVALFKRYKLDNAQAIAAILSLNTIANTIGAAGVGRQATLVFGSHWFGLVSAVTTVLILVFSEIVPKTIGTSQWRRLMIPTAYIIRALIVVLYPVVFMVESLTKLIAPKDDDEASVSREEVAAMADMGEDEGVIDEDENKIIQNVIKLGEVKAYDVMTPRVVAATAPEGITLREFNQLDECSHFSRIPVYADDEDFITGYVLRSDALEELADDHFDKKLGAIKRPIPLFNDEMSVADIWDALLKQRVQIGGIIDEYGTFLGIITMEDIIETIFGLEIIDENDEVTDMQQLARERWQQRQRRFAKIKQPATISAGNEAGR